MNFKHKIIVFLVTIIVTVLIKAYFDKISLRKNFHRTCAIIEGYRYPTRGQNACTYFYYFMVNNVRYNGIIGTLDSKILRKDASKLVGQKFVVLYSPSNPNLNRLLVFPEHYQEFNLEFDRETSCK